MNGQEDSERSNLITSDSLTLSVSYEVVPRGIASSSVNTSRVMSDQSQGPAENIKDQLGATTDQYARITIWGNVSVCL